MTTDPRSSAQSGEAGQHVEADTPNRAAQNLALLDHETQRLLATVDGLVAHDLGAQTLCPGWSVAHVLTHLARNADALLNLVRWALDGHERAPYPSEEARDADIEAGASRPLEVIVADVRTSAEHFRQEAAALRGPAGAATVRSRLGVSVTGAQVIAMRSLEVIFHHVDLKTGYTFAEVDPRWVARTLRRGARQWEAVGAPALTLVADNLEPIHLGDGGSMVSGTAADLLLWLARGSSESLTADVELPTPPPWA